MRSPRRCSSCWRCEKPLLIEGPAGVGKTESAKVLAEVLGHAAHPAAVLRRPRCDGRALRVELPAADAARAAERDERRHASSSARPQIFSEPFLLKRPLLEAMTEDRSPVLLIDEVDRADEAFEAFLLEVLAEWQVTIPELGTIRARHRPHVILTSNRTRELSDALRRRCLFLWLPYPSLEQEIEILHARVPGLSERLADQIARLMQVLRGLPLQKAPGVAESLDWAMALMSLHRDHLDARTLEQTLGCVLKVHEDHACASTHRAAIAPVLASAAQPEPGGYASTPTSGSARSHAAPLMYPFASLPDNLAAFCGVLRRNHGFRIGPGRTARRRARARGRRSGRRARGAPCAAADPDDARATRQRCSIACSPDSFSRAMSDVRRPETDAVDAP